MEVRWRSFLVGWPVESQGLVVLSSQPEALPTLEIRPLAGEPPWSMNRLRLATGDARSAAMMHPGKLLKGHAAKDVLRFRAVSSND